MSRLLFGLLVVFALEPTQAGFLDRRVHVWSRAMTTNGVQLSLVIRGQPSKLNMREREVLNEIARLMTDLHKP